MRDETKTHTPGPWEFDQTGQLYKSSDPVKQISWFNFTDGYWMISNDHDRALIKAAPDLLAACEETVRNMRGILDLKKRPWSNMVAAIKKAKGE